MNIINAQDLRYDLTVFIGRFQIFHNGHLHVIEEALKQSRTVLVIIGSANEARKPDRLPFTADERREMIINSLDKNLKNSLLQDTTTDRERVIIKYAEDFGNMTLWTEQIQRLASEALMNDENPYKNLHKAKIALIGHAKDNSSFYLKAFPQWDSINVDQKHILSATDIRSHYFKLSNEWKTTIDPMNGEPFKADFPYSFFVKDYADQLPIGTIKFLREFRKTSVYEEMSAEIRFMENYLAQWDNSPYKPNFITVDNVVIQSGHILLIQRKSYPGKGLWALPGGHLEQDETVDQGTLRELKEETKLKVPESVLKGSIVATKYFDNPYRSARKRTLTFATLFHLQPKVPDRLITRKTDGSPDTFAETEAQYKKRVKNALALPRVTAADDAKRAIWVPLDQLKRDQMFEDHYQIIITMKSLIKDE